MMEALLLIDFGSTYTKVTAVDPVGEQILGTAHSFTTVHTDIQEGLDNALRLLTRKLGKIDYTLKLACSSAAGGLRMITVGMVPDLTAEAAKMAALSAGAKVMKVFSFDLSQSEAEEIYRLKPEIILLTGGTDGGNKSCILHNAEIIAKIEGDFPVIVAGNKSVSDRVASILEAAGKNVVRTENVMPRFNVLNIEPARECIRNIFLERIVRAKGLTRISRLIEGILMPTPAAVLHAAHRLALGFEDEAGLGDLLVIDVGGATTDVYSVAEGLPTRSGAILKGLPEPYVKRTVEGDLGVRYSARSLVETVGIESVMDLSGLSSAAVQEMLLRYEQSPDILPAIAKETGLMDYGLTALSVRAAVERHTGKIETTYSPLGTIHLQTGKDLTNLRTVIGTGGPVIHNMNPAGVFREIKYDTNQPALLKPVNPAFYLDHKYILAAMGLLSNRFPKTAVRIMKRELIPIEGS